MFPSHPEPHETLNNTTYCLSLAGPTTQSPSEPDELLTHHVTGSH
jgi:hypothetical protein